MEGMRLPQSADCGPEDVKEELPDRGERYIMNPYPDREMLTAHEAMDMINHLSGVLLIDERHRRHTKGVVKN